MRSLALGCVLLLGLFASLGLQAGDEDASLAESIRQKKERLASMQAALDDCMVTATRNNKETTLKFAANPLLRYDDPTRDLLHAGVWRLGETGRPAALVTLEIYQASGAQKLTYEFVSGSDVSFSLASPRGVKWSPAESGLKMAVLPDATKPAESSKERLKQMRELARRFSVHEVSSGNRVECRLLSQPIDRYADSESGIVDGAVFVFANGTNPELALLLECSDREWSYGVLRMTSARIYAELDGRQFFEAPWFNKYSEKSPYTAAGHPLAR